MLSRRRHNRRVFILLIPALITASMLSLLIGNFGTVVRERMQVVVLLVPIVSMGLALRAANRRERSQFSGRPPTASLGASVPGETI